MKTFESLVKRNSKLFFRDKGSHASFAASPIFEKLFPPSTGYFSKQ